jgi:hypothetical protein
MKYFFGCEMRERNRMFWFMLKRAIVWVIVWVAVGVFCVPGWAETGVRITNFSDGETIRYSVPLIRGELSDLSAQSVLLTNQTSLRTETNSIRGAAFGGRFVVLADLVPGPNQLTVRCGEAETRLTLIYKPQTNPYVVRAIYATDESGDTRYQSPIPDDPQNYREKIGTALLLLQSAWADWMQENGYGRRTFNLELDGEGRVVVYLLRGDRSREAYHELTDLTWYDAMYRLIERDYPMDRARNVVVAAYTEYKADQKRVFSHTALGGGGLALFGGGCLYTWPNGLSDVVRVFSDATRVDPMRVLDDSCGRGTYWATASTTIGAMGHELGHTFDLPHTTEPRGLMGRGFDWFNRSFTRIEPPCNDSVAPYVFTRDETVSLAPANAAFLRHSRYLALDWQDYHPEERIEFVPDLGHDRLEIRAGTGLSCVAFDVEGNVVDCDVFVRKETDRKDEDAALPTVKIYELKTLCERLKTRRFGIRVRDGEGNVNGVDAGAFCNPDQYLRAWRFVSTLQPWPSAGSFVALSSRRLEEIEADARENPLKCSVGGYVDLLAQFPSARPAWVVGYALGEVRVKRARKLRLLTGSDDALRVWVNGTLVTQALDLRPARPDQEAVEIDLKAGVNRLLVEVSQATGEWGFYARLEDLDGAPVRVDEAGTLKLAPSLPAAKAE